MISVILALLLFILVCSISLLIFYIVTIISIISKEKWIWLLIVLLFPFIGMILYWLVGRKSKK